MEDKKFKVIIVEDVKLELKGTEEIFRHEIPNAEVIGTAMTEQEFWTLIGSRRAGSCSAGLGDWGGSTTIGGGHLPEYLQALSGSTCADIHGRNIE